MSILEAGFAQRERLAVEKVRAEVEAEGRAEVERAVREQEEAVGKRLKVRIKIHTTGWLIWSWKRFS